MHASLLTGLIVATVLTGVAAPEASAASAALVSGEAFQLSPHRAVYDMTLASARSGSSIAGVSGRMAYEFSGTACEGYTLNMRLVTEVTDRSGQATVTDLRSETWEHGEGQSFRFDNRQYTDEQLSEASSGTAERVAADSSIKVRIDEPNFSERTLAGDVIFPTQHSLAVLAAAREGRSLVQAPIFDGSEKGEKVYETTTFIGRAYRPGEEEALGQVANGEVLAELPSWSVSIGYFESNSAAVTTPIYELAFRLYANGVSRDLTIDYGDFVIYGALTALEFFPPGRCP